MRYYWEIETKKFILDFKVPYYKIGLIRGRFLTVNGVVTADEFFEDPEITLYLPVKSISTMDQHLDDKLKSVDFLGSEEFPSIDFFSANGCLLRSGRIKELTGQLWIKGKIRPVTLVVTSAVIKSAIKVPSAWFTASTTLRLTDFGFSIANDVIGNDVQLIVQISFLRSRIAED